MQEIADKARRDKKRRFRNLYRILNERFLIESWLRLNRIAASGIDRITANEYSTNLQANIRDLVDSIKNNRYHTWLVRRMYIPKGKGEQEFTLKKAFKTIKSQALWLL